MPYAYSTETTFRALPIGALFIWSEDNQIQRKTGPNEFETLTHNGATEKKNAGFYLEQTAVARINVRAHREAPVRYYQLPAGAKFRWQGEAPIPAHDLWKWSEEFAGTMPPPPMPGGQQIPPHPARAGCVFFVHEAARAYTVDPIDEPPPAAAPAAGPAEIPLKELQDMTPEELESELAALGY